MAVDYVCIISASILWHNVEYVKVGFVRKTS